MRELFRDDFFFADFFFRHLLPLRRASDSPIAIACLRLLTFFLLRPLFSVPFLHLNQGLANPAAMPTYYIDPKRRVIDAN